MTAAIKTNGHTPRVAIAARSDREPGLLDALLAFHAEAPKLQRDATGQIQNRTYGYVTLDGLLDAVEPLLLKHDLLWVTKPTTDGHGQPALRYRLTHVPSGEYDEDVMPLMCAKPDPQGQGSALTYARRYALIAVLNLAPGDDDDGLLASTPVDKYAQAAAFHAGREPEPVVPPLDDPRHDPAPRPTAAPSKGSERPATARQRTMLEIRAREAGLAAGQLANVILTAAGDEPREWRSDEHAEQTLARMLDRLPASLVTAVKDGIDQIASAS